MPKKLKENDVVVILTDRRTSIGWHAFEIGAIGLVKYIDDRLIGVIADGGLDGATLLQSLYLNEIEKIGEL